MAYVLIAEEEEEEPIELPTEEDETLLLSTLQAQYPNACGLQWRNEETKFVRGVRLAENRFYPPADTEGWGSKIFFCVFPKGKKRKMDDNIENSIAKIKHVETRSHCTDLIVLNLSFKTNEETFRKHFEKYGDVAMLQIKKDFNTGRSKGYAFVRFSNYESQVRALYAKHTIDGRLCEVKISQKEDQQIPSKIYVGRCTEDLSSTDLEEYFSKYGDVIDVFIPRPFKAFAFVTFLDPGIAQSLCEQNHIIKDVSVDVSIAAPKVDRNRFNQNNMNRSNNRNGNFGRRSDGRGFTQNLNGYGMNNGKMGGDNYNTGNYGMNNGSSGNNHKGNRGNMPNRNSNQMSNVSNNQLNDKFNLNSVSMNPEIVAAALRQWVLRQSQLDQQGRGDN